MIRRLCRFAGHLIKHPGLPHWLKVTLGVCLLIPGPVDELLVAPVVVWLLITRRYVLAECWERSAGWRYEPVVEWTRRDGIDIHWPSAEPGPITDEGDLR